MTFAKLFYHIVWATKNREPVLVPDIEEKIFSHIQKKANFIGCNLLAINGYLDHVHILIEIPPKLSVSDVIKILKGSSSFDFPEIYWQRGYGALTVSERNLNVAIEYINGQKEHHAQNKIINKYEKCDDDKQPNGKMIKENQENYEIDEHTSDLEF